LTEYEKKIVGGDTPPAYSSIKVEQAFPINPKGSSKTFYNVRWIMVGLIMIVGCLKSLF